MDTLSSTTLIPSSSLLRRFLARLPKQTLVSLVLIWLEHPLCPLHTAVDDEDEGVVEMALAALEVIDGAEVEDEAA